MKKIGFLDYFFSVFGIAILIFYAFVRHNGIKYGIAVDQIRGDIGIAIGILCGGFNLVNVLTYHANKWLKKKYGVDNVDNTIKFDTKDAG